MSFDWYSPRRARSEFQVKSGVMTRIPVNVAWTATRIVLSNCCLGYQIVSQNRELSSIKLNKEYGELSILGFLICFLYQFCVFWVFNNQYRRSIVMKYFLITLVVNFVVVLAKGKFGLDMFLTPTFEWKPIVSSQLLNGSWRSFKRYQESCSSNKGSCSLQWGGSHLLHYSFYGPLRGSFA